ncbi:MAG: PAS domain-containing protein [Anaerolineae bacterium]|nr:PAS domain-containing protein [Anaerolineae bacterium]
MFKQRLQRIVIGLITPAPTVRNEEDRNAARLLAAIALTLIGLMVIVLLLGVYQPLDLLTYAVVIGGMAATFAVYRLSRTRHYKPGVLLLIGIIVASNIVLAFNDMNPYHAIFLVVPIFITSLFASVLATGGVATLAIFLTLFIFGRSEELLSRTLVTVLFILMISVLIVISGMIRRAVQHQLKERTRQLEISEARFRAAIEGSLDSFFLLASIRDDQGKITDFRFVEVNEHAAQMVSEQREKLIGQLLGDRLRFQRDNAWVDKYVQVVETGELLEEEFQIVLPDQQIIWLHHQVVPVNDGIAITARNITGRKAAELVVRDNEARNRAMIAALPDLLFVISRNGIYLDYHAPEPAKIPVDPAHLVNQHVRDVLPPDIAEQIMAKIAEAFATEEVQLVEYALDLQEGRREFEARIVTYQDDKILTIIRDITERREAEQSALEVQIERERMRLLSNFIRNSSHEFRTPLAVISSGAYLMVKTEDRQERQERAHRIEEQVQSITRLVDDLVLIARLDSGIMLECEPLDLYSIVSQITDGMQTAAQKKQQQLIFKPESQHVRVNGNLEILSIALLNLIENAVIYTPPGSEISIQIEKIGLSAMVFFQDNGPGMTEEIQGHIFEAFYRGDAAHSTRGLGLGLAIVRKAIEIHGGEIQVNSQPGKGSLFTVILPRLVDDEL